MVREDGLGSEPGRTPPDRPSQPRPAATIVVARASSAPDRGVEVLVLRRSPHSRFAPGFVVFPGGVIEEGDRSLARRWFGRAEEAARACALRELAEETGLVATARGLLAMPGRLPGEPDRPAPAVDAVPELARWVAPAFLPVRFDAVFFGLAAQREVEPTADGVEADLAWWSPAADLLRGHAEGTVRLMWPTVRTLQALAGCRSVEEVMALRVEQASPPADWAPGGPGGPGRPADGVVR